MNGGNIRKDHVTTNRGNDGSPSLNDPQCLLDQRGVRWASHEERALGMLRLVLPYQESPSRKERVASALARTRVRGLPRLLGPVTIMGLLVGFGAVASAAIWHWPDLVVQAYDRLGFASSPPSIAPPPVPDAVREHRPHGSIARVMVPLVADRAIPVPAQDRDPAPPSALRRDVSSRPLARRAASVPTNEDTGPVLAAMRALRREHDPVRARALLGIYLSQNPNGALAEEVLAMSIEAAVAHHDSDAPVLASRYLYLYPTGPFRALARRTLGEPAAQPAAP
jgi:hypothetical protein